MIKKLLRYNLIVILTSICILIFCNNILASTLSDEQLYCNNDLVMDLDSGNILYGKNENDKIYPASTTKILTAILVLENSNLNETVTVSQKAYNSIPYNSSVMGVKAGEIYTIEDLLYGLMLPSGNDAALVLAEHISGSVQDFVILMNNKLKELGLTNTHFVNPHGYHDDSHYSTPLDMANLFKYCMQNDNFKKIITTLKYELKPTNLTTEARTLRNTSRISDPKYTNIYYEYILGGKTGYTTEANGTYIGYGSKDGKNIVVCAFNGSQNINGNQGRFLDTKKLAEYAFENFKYKDLIKASDYRLNLYDSSESKYYMIGLNDNVSGLFKKDENIIIDYEITADFNSLSLLSYSEETSVNSSKVGTLNIYDTNKNLIKSVDLVYLGSKINILNNKNILTYLIPSLSIILIFILISVSSSKKKSKSRKSKRKLKI